MADNYQSDYCQSSKDIDFGKDKETANIYSQMTGEGLVSTEKKKSDK